MQKKIVFAFAPAVSRFKLGTHINLLFHKRGLFRGDGQKYSTYVCPVDALDWSAPELQYVSLSLPSVLMRFVMHPSIVCQYADTDHLVITTTDHENIRDSIVILHKSLLFKDGLNALETLKKNNNIVIFDLLDYVDPALEENLAYLDGLILCSKKSFAYYSNLDWITVPRFFVTHCIDTRIPERTDPLPEFSPLYHGAPENVLLYPSLLRILPIAYCYPEFTPPKLWMEKTLNANFFYALRPPVEEYRGKPFQKGFTASQLASNILIHKDDGDALHYLGSDYPYLIHEEPTEEVVFSYMLMAKKDFNGPRWNKGLEIMQSLKPHFSHERIAGEFWDMIRRYL